jgi:PRD domain protein (TIGR03582 family)
MNLKQYLIKSQDPDVCERLYNDAIGYIHSKGYEIKDNQKEALLNHISEMVKRNINKETLHVEDKTVFNEVSQESMNKASDMVNQLKYISDDETYLLSIHFEVVKYN